MEILRLSRKARAGSRGRCAFAGRTFAASLTAYRQRLHDEIVDIFDPITFLSSTENREGSSRRWGIESEIAWQPFESLRLSASYAYLKSTQPDNATDRQLEEWRRPRHSGSLAADGSAARWSYGASLTFAGSHLDRQEVQPFAIVRLDSYWLAAARVAYAVRPGIELFARGSNLFDADYEDSAGYRTEGRGLFRRRQAGGSAIIAVKLASAANLPSTLARPANLHTDARF